MTNNDRVVIPGTQVPSYRTTIAIQNGVEKNLLFTTWGGIGDQMCAEPTLRFALDTFKGCRVSLASEHPEFFAHLKFDEVFDLKETTVDYSKFLVFQTINDPKSLTWEFMSHMVTNCVDFPSLCAIRCQLPIDYKQIRISCVPSINPDVLEVVKNRDKCVIMHAGRHWESKTFPKDWWDAAYDAVVEVGLTPVWIGKDVDPNVGIVNAKIDDNGIDLRNQCSLNDTIWLCQNTSMMLCSDSAPLHMAASGDAWIAYIATVKHPDYITHWRKGGWSWRMKNFGKGGIWEEIDFCPNKTNDINVDTCPQDLLATWLPNPKEAVEWLKSNVNS